MRHDIQYALRTLVRTPGFTAVAIVTLALGIGANTAIFSVVQAVVLRPLPYDRPEELMALHESMPAKIASSPAPTLMAITPPTIRDWSANSTFSSIAAYAASDVIVTGSGDPERIPSADVSWNLFETFRVNAAAGRLLRAEDDQPNQPLVAVIGEDLWRSRFGGDPGVIGRTVELSGKRHSIVGVAAEGFAFPAATQVWMPLALPPDELADNQRLSFYLQAVGRLKPGVTQQQASIDLNRIAAGLAPQFPQYYKGRGVTVLPLHEEIVGDARSALLILLGTVGFVLLIACANVANLLLARAASREGEIAVRGALGATRSRIVRQLLTESVMLAFAGAAAGLMLAMWARDAIVSLAPPDVPRIADVRIDPWVLGFTGLLALSTGVLFGLVPALITTRRNLGSSMKTSGRAGGATRTRLRGAMVIGELALSLALLVGAGLLARTMWNLMNVDPGFRADGVMTMEIVLPRPKYPEPAQRAMFVERVLEQLASNATIQAAGGATNLPLSNTNMSFGFYKQTMVPGSDVPLIANFRGITHGYFDSLGIPLIRGRAFNRTDREGSAPVIIVNAAMARKYWPDRDPLGERIAVTRGRTTVWREIVGISGDVRHAALGSEPAPEMYMPYAHDAFQFVRIAVRSAAPPDTLASAMRAAVWAVDRDQPVSKVRPMADLVSRSIASQRFNAILIGSFALLALALAAIGLYGVIAYSVAQRRHEIGVRMALGADSRHVVGLVLRQGLILAAGGVALGAALAIAVTRVVVSQLYQTTATDPTTLAAVAGALAAIALFASYVPARRALRVDPIAALRSE